MSFLDRFPKKPTTDELLQELRYFFLSSSRIRSAKGDETEFRETIRVGLWLLRHLPVARDGVFDIISVVYEEFVQKYLANVEQGDSIISLVQEDIDDFLNDIHNTFVLFLDECGEIWSPILSSWALHLLGQFSKANSNRPLFARILTVNEVITTWMGSKAVQSLLTITSRCLTCKDHSSTDSFISALLDTSSANSPHFDWVVAHVGNTYPQIVVTEVLNIGLTNFSSNPPQGSKLSSVSGILGHLSTTHANEVQAVFDQMFQNVLSGMNPSAERFAIPYLLQICSSSITLLDVLMDSVLPIIKEDALIGIQQMVQLWIQLHFGNNPHALMALVTHLILKSHRGPIVLEILMNGSKHWRVIGIYVKTLLQNFLVEISSLLYQSSVPHKDLVKNFPCITALKDCSEMLIKYLADEDEELAHFSSQLSELISFYEGETVGVQAIVHYCQHSKGNLDNWHLAEFIGCLDMKYTNILGNALQNLVVESRIHHLHNGESGLRCWKTILALVKTEVLRPDVLPVNINMSVVIRENLATLLSLLDTQKLHFRLDEALILTGILAHVPDLTCSTPFLTLIKVERFLVDLLFHVIDITKKELGRTEKFQQVLYISKLLNHLCTNTTHAIQNDALRSLVQTCLSPDVSHLFKHKIEYSSTDDAAIDSCDPVSSSMYVSLLEENQKRSSNISMNRTLSSSFHSGKFVRNHRRNSTPHRTKIRVVENIDADVNVTLFLSTVVSVCMAIPNNGRDLTNDTKSWRDLTADSVQEVNVEAMRKVALLLVEIVSPDVMFNGLPWPEEEFSKVQIERDLQIRRAFEDHPYLWNLLELVANYSPSLCYCSVLLRALMATFMTNWASSQKAKSKNYPSLLNGTIRLINIMKLGQLIPPPLSHVGILISEFKANEVLSLLKDIWWYMKVHVPIPTLFIKDPHSGRFVRDAEFLRVPAMYTESLRLMLINNMESVGYLYPKLFPIIPTLSPPSSVVSLSVGDNQPSPCSFVETTRAKILTKSELLSGRNSQASF